MTTDYQKAIDLLESADTVAVFMHVNPDPDCIGSSLAFSAFLRKMGKKAYSFTPDTRSTSMIMKKNECLPHFSRLNKCDEKKFDLSVAVDLGETGRIGQLALPLFEKGEKSLVIDHHETFSDFADVTIREKDASSAAQIIYKLLCKIDKSLIDKDIATLLYAGILTDSGNFSYEMTSSETFMIAAELLSYGVDFVDITRKLTKDEPYNVFRLKTNVLSNAKFICDKKIGIISFSRKDFLDTGTAEKDTDGIVNLIQNIDSVLLAVSLSEVGDKQYKVSFRSKGNVSARKCAEFFGGGGHDKAAGCRVNGDYDTVYKAVTDVAYAQILHV